ncbi:hypothetical protein CALCODRAFT_42057 [Calocera cornea HHB12733]|uniref:Uncharacterized protein n=1 Tax=Calocera cornea HHB12733 TaxID=1353952 RepID=A0A165DWM0_9BASI|nr:hypothetical protein CALCODRAFT_42057 [Calocera cornea HHB12733]
MQDYHPHRDAAAMSLAMFFLAPNLQELDAVLAVEHLDDLEDDTAAFLQLIPTRFKALSKLRLVTASMCDDQEVTFCSDASRKLILEIVHISFHRSIQSKADCGRFILNLSDSSHITLVSSISLFQSIIPPDPSITISWIMSQTCEPLNRDGLFLCAAPDFSFRFSFSN